MPRERVSSPSELLAMLTRFIKRTEPLLGALATVGRGEVACARMMVLREVDSGSILLSTHARATKVGDLRRHPQAELVLWLTEKRIQLRLRAKWNVIDGVTAKASPKLAAMRQESWLRHSPASQKLFDGPPPEVRMRATKARAVTNAPPADFTILVGTITQMDALLIANPAHQRFIHERVGDLWRSTRVTP